MIKPSGSTITFGSTTLFVDDAQFEFTSEFFDRNEFEHEKLRTAKETNGTIPIFLPLFGGRIVQIITTCTHEPMARPVTPNDTAVDQIKQRFDIRRYTLKGLPSLSSNVSTVETTAMAHKVLLDRFQAHIAEVALDISYELLISLQSETFSYLTGTGYTITGNSLLGSESNMIIRSFSTSCEYEIPGGATYRSWNAVVDNLVIVPASNTGI